MSEEAQTKASSRLLIIAGQAIEPLIDGCANTLKAPGPGGLPSIPGRPPAMAIDRFGPLILQRWREWLVTVETEVQAFEFQQLASLTPEQANRLARRVIDAVHPSASEDDKSVAVAYLAAIPNTMRAVLVPDRKGVRVTVAATTWLADHALVRLLPVNVPPYPIGTDLPGTPYRLEDLLGCGGFGAVYKATNRFEQNTSPRAIKFCLNAERVAGLKRERDLLDRLTVAAGESQWSDRIVKLYGHSLDTPVPFLVYEYVPGGSLSARLIAHRKQTGEFLRPSQVVGLIRRICEAVAFAHASGLVHRDLKPSNILISGNTVKLTDFGIGGMATKRPDTGEHLSVDALSMSEQSTFFRGAGTPLYMCPEQRKGEKPDPRHDVYSIGVIWYQLLVGDLSRELHAGWADELADEYDIPQKQIDVIQQCVGVLKKRPADAREILDLLPSPTQATAPPMKPEPTGLLHTLTGHESAVTCLAFLRDGRRLVSGSRDGTLRFWETESGQHVATHRINGRPILSLAISPDDRRALVGSEDRNAWLLDLARATDPICLAGHVMQVQAVAFSPDSRRAVTGSDDGTIRLWHVATGREILRIETGKRPVTGVAFSTDGLLVLACTEGGFLQAWDTETGWAARDLCGPGGWLTCVAVSPDGTRAACGGKSVLSLWDLKEYKILGQLPTGPDMVMGLAFSPSGHWLVSGGMGKTVRVWDVNSRRHVYEFEAPRSGVNAVALAANGRYAAAGSDNHRVYLWALPHVYALQAGDGPQT